MNIKLDIPESFYAGEERCGYYVSPEMKKVWAVELDMIAEFARICDKYSLRWWVEGGTLLGAARHKGFIPWDDDVDIVMMRKDYEKLCEISGSEFQHPYHLRSPYNDKERIQEFAKLHNEDTTMIDGISSAALFRNGRKFGYSQGIWIDIFPLYDIPDNDEEFMPVLRKARRYKETAGLLYTIAFAYTPASTKWKRPFKAALHFMSGFADIGARYMMKCFAKYFETINLLNSPDSKYVANISPTTSHDFWKKFRVPRSFFDETVYMTFEMLTVPAPSCYETILTQYYGEWQKYVIGHLHSTFYDTERSYKYYIEHGLPEGV
ncbi:MAG: LicD family protein [Synergistaceae bacterium]|nr:LicD family protein [Synergistaceae bacterium]